MGVKLGLTFCVERRLRVLENRVLRKIFGSKRDNITGDWRRLHNGELYDLHYSRNIIQAIKSRGMRWAALAARVVYRRCIQGF